jgi:lysylphosphatidylglycerol synthetase-like protein (DUF2156 family)
VQFSEFRREDLRLERLIEENGAKWLRARRGPQIHISNIYLFDDTHGKRWFYAHVGGQVVGSVSLNQLEKKQGWLINHLMVIPEAPIGTSELLFTHVLEALNTEGCRYATVGAITAQRLGQIQGFHPIVKSIARTAFGIAKKVYDLDGLNMFWGKFHPDKEPLYLLFGKKGIGLRELLGISRAMNGPI